MLFQKLLVHACKYVPYYRENLSTNIDLRHQSLQEVLNYLPLLNKSIVRSCPEKFVSEFYNRSKLIKLNTSGTTGTPLTVYITPEARQLNYAFFARSKKWAGVEGLHRKSATFAGRTIVSPDQKNPPFWRKNLIANKEWAVRKFEW